MFLFEIVKSYSLLKYQVESDVVFVIINFATILSGNSPIFIKTNPKHCFYLYSIDKFFIGYKIVL